MGARTNRPPPPPKTCGAGDPFPIFDKSPLPRVRVTDPTPLGGESDSPPNPREATARATNEPPAASQNVFEPYAEFRPYLGTRPPARRLTERVTTFLNPTQNSAPIWALAPQPGA